MPATRDGVGHEDISLHVRWDSALTSGKATNAALSRGESCGTGSARLKPSHLRPLGAQYSGERVMSLGTTEHNRVLTPLPRRGLS